MRGMDGDLFPGLRVDPPMQDPAAREHDGVRPVAVNDGELDILVKRRGRNRLPHPAIL